MFRTSKLATAVALVVAVSLFLLSLVSFWDPGLSGATRAVTTSILIAMLGFGGTLWIAAIMSVEK